MDTWNRVRLEDNFIPTRRYVPLDLDVLFTARVYRRTSRGTDQFYSGIVDGVPVGVFVNYFLLNQEIKKISFKLGSMKYVVGNIVMVGKEKSGC